MTGISEDRTPSVDQGLLGNFGVMLRAYVYIHSMGAAGLKLSSENAVLNANYMKFSLKDDYKTVNDKTTMHEVVFAGLGQDQRDLHPKLPSGSLTMDIIHRPSTSRSS